MNRSALLLSLCLAVAPFAPAAADPIADARGRELYKKGEDAYAIGNYAEAADAFQRAFEVSHRTRLLWNLASAHRSWFEVDPDVAHLRRARTIYENYAALIGEPGEAAEAKIQIQQLDARIAALTAAPPPKPSLTPVEKAPAVAPLPTTPPPPTTSPEPLYKKWWLWTSVGGIALIGAGVGVGVALGVRHDASPPGGLTAGTFTPSWP